MDALSPLKIEAVKIRPQILGCRVGHIVRVESNGMPVVEFPGNPFGPQHAACVESMSLETVAGACRDKRPVLLIFADNDASQPVIVDVLAKSLNAVANSTREVPCATVLRTDTLTAASVSATFIRGSILGVEDGRVLVEPNDMPGGVIRALSILPLRNLKDPVLLLQVDGELAVVLGQFLPCPVLESDVDGRADLVLRGNSVRIEAASVLTLNVGACRVELDATGRASVVGDHIVSRARVSNKVQGGSVQLN